MISQREFKDSLAQWPTGVVVVTLQRGDNAHAITINSWSSASLEPPLVSFFLKTASWYAPHIMKSSFFGAHLLHATQSDVAQYYATPGGAAWKHGKTTYSQGSPRLEDFCIGWECRHIRSVPVGDHMLVVGQVHTIEQNNKKNMTPLIYWDRAYQTLPKILPKSTPKSVLKKSRAS